MPCLHLATGADSSAANQGEAAPARAVWRAGSRPDQATEGETADSRIEAKARTWPLAFIWRRARIHLATGADSSAANQGEAAPARAVWRAGSRPDQATEGETADSRIEAKARTWPGRGNVPKLRRRARTDPKRSWRIRR